MQPNLLAGIGDVEQNGGYIYDSIKAAPKILFPIVFNKPISFTETRFILFPKYKIHTERFCFGVFVLSDTMICMNPILSKAPVFAIP